MFSKSRSIAVITLLAIFTPLNSAHPANPPKPGAKCVKQDKSQNYKGKKYTCVKSGKTLTWSKGVTIKPKVPNPIPSPSATPETSPAPSPSPTPSPTETPKLTFKLTEAYTDHGLAKPGEIVTDHLGIESNFEIIEIQPFLINSEQAVVLTGSAERIQGDGLKGKWRIKFEFPKSHNPGKYIRKYTLVSENGLTANALDFPIEITPPKFWINKTCSESKNDCPPVSNQSAFANIATCKIEDLTPDPSAAGNFARNGFPRQPHNWKNPESPKTIVVPVEYTDIPFDNSLTTTLDKEYEKAKKFYSDNSYGQLNLSFETAPRASWVTIPMKWSEWSKQNKDDLATITRATINLVKDLDLTKYDSIFFGSSKVTSFYWGGGTHWTYSTPTGIVENVYFTVGGTNLGLEHNLGHTLYQLEDLYIHGGNTEAMKARSETVIRYDIMANGASPDYFGWNRWLNGWLKDEEIACLPSNLKSETIKIGYLSNKEGKRLLVIPGTRGTALFAEYREALFNDGKGIYIYDIDTQIPHGSGPLQGFPKLLSSNESAIYKGYKFTVLGADENAAYLKIEKQ